MTSVAVPRPKVAVVLGPWSSGTSAVAAAIAALGANAHPPFLRLNDPRTPVSGESRELRRILGAAFSHELLTRTATPAWILPRLRIWAGPGLSVAKMPMLTWFLPEILAAWDAHFVIVARPIEKIEATRARRGWPAIYGRVGAERIRSLIARDLPAEVPRLEIAFEALCDDPVAEGASLAQFLDLPMDPDRLRAAVRRS